MVRMQIQIRHRPQPRQRDGQLKLCVPHMGVKGFAYRRVKNDVRDASDLADLLRMGRLPEAYVAPPAVRDLRELVRHRAKMVAMRSSLKAQVHAVLAKQGVRVAVSDLCRREGISPNLYYLWKKQLLSSANKIFDAKAGRPSAAEEKKSAELQRLKDVVVEITTENLELTKGLSAKRLSHKGW